MLLIAIATTDLRARCNAGLQSAGMVLTTGNYESLRQAMSKLLPDLLLVDMALPGFIGAESVADLCRLSPYTKIIVLGGALSDAEELALFAAGARGFCHNSIEPQKIRSIVTAVSQGQIWIRRSLVARLLDTCNSPVPPEIEYKANVTEALTKLTAREQAIAALVSAGDTNKQIARHLSISESTVKAHLSKIFRKLSVTDRLMLALRIIELREAEQSHKEEAPPLRKFPALKLVKKHKEQIKGAA